MFESLKAKIIVAIVVAVLAGLGTWRVMSWRAEAQKVPGLEKDLEAEKQKVLDAIAQCDESKQPAKEANDYDYTKLNNSLTLCLDQLRKSPGKCVPVHSAGVANGTNSTSKQSASGIAESAIIANDIECQADRDALNAAKIWAKGYQKWKEGLNDGKH